MAWSVVSDLDQPVSAKRPYTLSAGVPRLRVDARDFIKSHTKPVNLCTATVITGKDSDIPVRFAEALGRKNGTASGSLFELQSILGRNDPKVTVCYAHLSAKARQEAANAGSVMVPRANLKVA